MKADESEIVQKMFKSRDDRCGESANTRVTGITTEVCVCWRCVAEY